jgi:Cu+-exporting ATPase
MNQAGSHGSHEVTSRNPPTKVEGMAKDPVCGMDVDPARSTAKRQLDGQTFHFCAEGCASKFDADPARYAKGAEEGAAKGCCCK